LGIGPVASCGCRARRTRRRRGFGYVDLLGSKKPHVLVGTDNGMALTTRGAYASSTKFDLEDKVVVSAFGSYHFVEQGFNRMKARFVARVPKPGDVSDERPAVMRTRA
jgi:hypothetical protein